MTGNGTAIVWFRQDLRLADHPALTAAQKHEKLIPLFIWAPDEEGLWKPGQASRWWLHDALASLTETLATYGSQLIIRVGSSQTVLAQLIDKHDVRAVYWHDRYEPAAVTRDQRIKTTLLAQGVKVETFNGSLLHDPSAVKTKADTPYLVYGAYWRALLQRRTAKPLPAPSRLPPPPMGIDGARLQDLALKPTVAWDAGLQEHWRPGERAAQKALAGFCDMHLTHYAPLRDVPGVCGTSRLSPYLHYGELSPRQVWHAAKTAATPLSHEGLTVFQRELVWREFSYYLLSHFPKLPTTPLRREFEDFPWQDNRAWLQAWQRGRTGYPIVDAGMRELWHTGWMHNRVRMITASFLVKDLRIAWQQGAAWFWDTLVDADLASNTQGWQWTAGCGADAAPYFRIFNPVLQGQKFDPDGSYVKRWVPELNRLPPRFIHKPWEAPADVLTAAGVTLGRDYPEPIVDHGQARFAALKAFDYIKRNGVTKGGQSRRPLP